MDKTTLGIIFFGLVLISFLAMAPPSRVNLPSQSIVPFQVTPTTIPPGTPKASSSIVAFQSIAFSANQFTSDVISFREGPITLTKFTFGIYNFIWLILIGIIIVLLLPKIEIRQIPEKDVPMNLINWIYLPIVFMSVLWMGGFLTGNLNMYSLFYILLFVIGLSVIGYLRTKGFKVNIAINDGILSNLVDVKFSTQLFLSIIAIFGIFLGLHMFRTNFAAFTISGGKLTAMNVAPFEDSVLCYVPTVLFLLVGNIIALSLLLWLRNEDVSRVFSLDKDYITQKINQLQKPFLVINVILVVLIATMSGYTAAYFHTHAYHQIAPFIAKKLGISEEEAYNEIIKSVGDMWSLSSIAISLTGTILPMDVVHIIVNSQSSD